jgi:hypothetical protein
MIAFNYGTQKWEDGESAKSTRIGQLAEELALLEGVRGDEYARFAGISKARAIAGIKAQQAGLKTGGDK